jgi:hypothetical protein
VVTEVDEAAALVATLAGRRGGQGRGLTAWQRKAVEDHAMEVAAEFCAARFSATTAVSRSESFDFRCRDNSGVEWHVEVKGTTGSGECILLTPNEVGHASDFPRTILIIVSGITLTPGPGGTWTAQGGRRRVIEPWKLDQQRLSPLGFEYSVPA